VYIKTKNVNAMSKKRTNHNLKINSKTTIAKAPTRKSSQSSDSVLGRKIIEVRERCGLLNYELCKLLTNELDLKKPISPSTLHTWITKKSIKTRKHSEAQIIQALESINKKYGKEGYSTWVDGTVVATKISEWNEYLTKTRIASELGISKQLLEAWSKGQHRVANKRWTEFLDIMSRIIDTSIKTKTPLESYVMKKKDAPKAFPEKKVGHKLISWIENIAISKGLDSKATAETLGITYGYWMNLKDGFSKDSLISRRFAEACANFLDAPVLSVFIAADSIRLSDFLLPTENLLREIDKAIEFIEKDVEYSALISENIRTIDYSLKYAFVVLYEHATKRKLLPDRLDVSAFLESLSKQ
jgi:transcriptional regulator with XRE-family HTH domain